MSPNTPARLGLLVMGARWLDRIGSVHRRLWKAAGTVAFLAAYRLLRVARMANPPART